MSPENARRYEEQVAIVTGGASGIGRSCALQLASEGASLVIADLDSMRGAETVAEVASRGGQATFISVDTSSQQDNENMVQTALDTYGQVDVLIAAAGVSSSSYVSGNVEESPDLKAEDNLINKQRSGPLAASARHQPHRRHAQRSSGS